MKHIIYTSGIGEDQLTHGKFHVEKLLGRKPLHLEDIIDNYRYMCEDNVTEYKDVR